LNTTSSRKTFEFDIDTGTRKFKTWVFSETGLDIEERFKGFAKISNIKEIKNDTDRS
jgi:hypothetical protein